MQIVKTPRVTAYALWCGAAGKLRKSGPNDNFRATMWYEHGKYHVRAVWFSLLGTKTEWNVFNTIKEARNNLILT